MESPCYQPGGATRSERWQVGQPRTHAYISASRFHGERRTRVAGASKKRNEWDQTQKDALLPFEGVAVRTVGYLVAVKVEDHTRSPHGESSSCHWTDANEVDWHMALVESASQGERECIVVETTPRVRLDHAKWTSARLTPWLNEPQPVRISGWLMYDPDHPEMVSDPAQPTAPHKYRRTLWEIHPVEKIEVLQDDGTWADLDSLP